MISTRYAICPVRCQGLTPSPFPDERRQSPPERQAGGDMEGDGEVPLSSRLLPVIDNSSVIDDW
jgi:hypothetical protein